MVASLVDKFAANFSLSESSSWPLLCYNRHRSCAFLIYEDNPGYEKMSQRIADFGVGGLKAYFGAVAADGEVRIDISNILTPEKW